MESKPAHTNHLPRVLHRAVRVTLACTAAVALGLVSAWTVQGASIVGSRHDLSSSGVDPNSNQPCVFCHTPHFANTTMSFQAPLWNRYIDLTETYTVYGSPTMDTVPGDPLLSISALCLGCHDGTAGTAVVNGFSGFTNHDLVNAPGPGGIPDTTSWPNCERCHGSIYGGSDPKWLGNDLSNEHPIAMTYPIPAEDAEFNIPPDLTDGWSTIPLYGGKVECPSCHAVHDPQFEPFLRISNASSQLCLTCHVK